MADFMQGPGMLGGARASVPSATQEQIIAATAKLKAMGIPASRERIAELIATDPTLGAAPAAPAGVQGVARGGPSSGIVAGRMAQEAAALEAERQRQAREMKDRQQEFLRARSGKVR